MTIDYCINRLITKYRIELNKAKDMEDSNPNKAKATEYANNLHQMLYWIMDYQELKDKDVSMKPIKSNKISSNVAVLCPRCDEYIQMIIDDKKHLQKFCSNCGQRLNWSEVHKNDT